MSRLLRSPRNDGSTCEPCSSSNVGKKRGNSISGPEQRAENDRTSPVEETGRSSFTREFRLSPATSRVPHGDFFPVRASSRPRRSEQRASVYANATPLPELMHVCQALGRTRAGQTSHGNPTWQSRSRRAGRASGALDTYGASLAEQ